MSDECNPKKTLCDGDRTHNCWIEGGDPNTGEGGVCLLDNLTAEQVVYIVERNPKAREDLKRVTTNEEVLALANETPPLPSGEYADVLQSEVNKNADTIPFYSVFRGQGPWNG